MLPSASLGAPDPKTGKRKALYEPVHGSAPDIAGKGLANPIATIASFGMALRYSFDMGKEADLLDQAIAGALAAGLQDRRHHAARHAPGGHRRDGRRDRRGARQARRLSVARPAMRPAGLATRRPPRVSDRPQKR